MVTLVIPTINKSDFIIEYLTFLKDNQFEGQVLIADASGKQHYDVNTNYINTITCNYRLYH